MYSTKKPLERSLYLLYSLYSAVSVRWFYKHEAQNVH